MNSAPEQVEQELMNMAFIQGFTELQRDAAETNTKNGFNSDDKFGGQLDTVLSCQGVPSIIREGLHPMIASFNNARAGLKLALVVGEIGEALEAVRKNLGADSHIPEFTAEEAEIADAIIRLMNYATDRKLRLAEAIVAKNEFNRNRQDHSKESRSSEHGKRF